MEFVVTVTAAGSVIVTDAVEEQLLASVTVTVYIPEPSEEAVALLPPEGAQVYENGPVPPETADVAEPFADPKQETFVVVTIVTLGDPAFEILTVAVVLQLNASVTVTE